MTDLSPALDHPASPDAPTALSPAPAVSATAAEIAAIEEFVPYETASALAAASTLRDRGFTPDQVSWVLNQAKTRTRAAAKFGERAQRMLFTSAGFEQATRTAVARWHAARFHSAGLASVADLGCGLGTDSWAFAEAGLAVSAVEIDPRTAALTAHNLAEFPTARVLVGDVQNADLSQLGAIPGELPASLWLDPARRDQSGGTNGPRIFDPEAFAPPLSFVRTLADTGIAMGVKMGPGLPHEHIPHGAQCQWVSHGGSVVEAVLWFNALAQPGVARTATLLDADPLNPHVRYEISSAHRESATGPVGELGRYLYEPDGAIVRSHLVAELAAEVGAHLLDERIAYLSADHDIDHPALQGFRVIDTMPINDKILKRWVREEGIGTLTIKKRGVDVVPEQLRKKLLAGSKKKSGKAATAREAMLVLTRFGEGASSQRVAIHVQPL